MECIMKLLFKQRFFSWLDSYDIYYEDGSVAYTVKGQLSWGHRLNVSDSAGNHVATLQERVFTFMPKFEIYLGDEYMGCISRKWTWFKPQYSIDFNGWSVEGSIFEWDYTIFGGDGAPVAAISKELFNFTDTYVIDVADGQNALMALMFVLAIDAEKCSRN